MSAERDRTYCGRCGHVMHWKVCWTPGSHAPECDCDNSISRIEPKPTAERDRLDNDPRYRISEDHPLYVVTARVVHAARYEDDVVGPMAEMEQVLFEARLAEYNRLSHIAWAQPVISAEEVARAEYYRYQRMVSEMRAELMDAIVAAVQRLPRGLPDRDDLVYRDDVLNEMREASDDR